MLDRLHLTIRCFGQHAPKLLFQSSLGVLKLKSTPSFLKNGYTHLNTHQLTASQCRSHHSFSGELSRLHWKPPCWKWSCPRMHWSAFCIAFRRPWTVKAEKLNGVKRPYCKWEISHSLNFWTRTAWAVKLWLLYLHSEVLRTYQMRKVRFREKLRAISSVQGSNWLLTCSVQLKGTSFNISSVQR